MGASVLNISVYQLYGGERRRIFLPTSRDRMLEKWPIRAWRDDEEHHEIDSGIEEFAADLERTDHRHARPLPEDEAARHTSISRKYSRSRRSVSGLTLPIMVMEHEHRSCNGRWVLDDAGFDEAAAHTPSRSPIGASRRCLRYWVTTQGGTDRLPPLGHRAARRTGGGTALTHRNGRDAAGLGLRASRRGLNRSEWEHSPGFP